MDAAVRLIEAEDEPRIASMWNTCFSDAALAALRDQGYPVRAADAARLSPLVDGHLNVHGRYSFAATAVDGLRPLRDPAEPAGED